MTSIITIDNDVDQLDTKLATAKLAPGQIKPRSKRTRKKGFTLSGAQGKYPRRDSGKRIRRCRLEQWDLEVLEQRRQRYGQPEMNGLEPFDTDRYERRIYDAPYRTQSKEFEWKPKLPSMQRVIPLQYPMFDEQGRRIIVKKEDCDAMRLRSYGKRGY